MNTKRLPQPPPNATDFFTLFADRLKRKGITLEHLLLFEQQSTLTKREIAHKFEAYLNEESHLYRTDQTGKKLALANREIVKQFSNQYATQIISHLGLTLPLPAQARTLSKVECLLQTVKQTDLDDAIQL
ncbi:MAG: hypothetical protein KME18_25170 [Phormidium tanganyikae FI6-MK23]|jgi:hypothetical protein|nr:hypothetical protein [Phormidium tanganyikae FI6-MK23]